MNIGEMQRLLSVKAEKEPNHQFDDLYGLLCKNCHMSKTKSDQ
jgi:hypothetical protein